MQQFYNFRHYCVLVTRKLPTCHHLRIFWNLTSFFVSPGDVVLCLASKHSLFLSLASFCCCWRDTLRWHLAEVFSVSAVGREFPTSQVVFFCPKKFLSSRSQFRMFLSPSSGRCSQSWIYGVNTSSCLSSRSRARGILKVAFLRQ